MPKDPNRKKGPLEGALGCILSLAIFAIAIAISPILINGAGIVLAAIITIGIIYLVFIFVKNTL